MSKDKGKGKATIQPNTPQKPDRPMRIGDYVSDKSSKPKTYDQVVSQKSSPPLKKTEFSQYVPKEFIMNVCPVEPEFRKQNIADTIQAIFPSHPIEGNWNFIPQNPKNDRIYYEYILVATNSISITHTESEENPYNQIKILQVLTPTTWGYSPYTAKNFPENYKDQVYNYFDYKEAWFNVLYYKNYNHSWFFWFDQKCPNTIPKWFLEWFHIFGPVKKILPEIVEGYNYFKENSSLKETEELFWFLLINRKVQRICLQWSEGRSTVVGERRKRIKVRRNEKHTQEPDIIKINY